MTAERELLAAVYADPASDGPRAVYADWLQERGDPRGEYIALALAPPTDERRARADELLAVHRTAWIGALATGAAALSARFRRGFPSQVPVLGPTAVGDPAWRTVEIVHGDIPATDAHPMPVLWSSRNVTASGIATLTALRAPPRLTQLSIQVGHREARETYATRLAALRLPHLAALQILDDACEPEDLATLLAIGPVASIHVRAAVDALPGWLEVLDRPRARASPLATLTLETLRAPISIARDPAGRFSRIAIEHPGPAAMPIYRLGQVMETLPANRLTAFAFTVDPKQFTIAVATKLVEALARHAGIELAIPPLVAAPIRR